MGALVGRGNGALKGVVRADVGNLGEEYERDKALGESRWLGGQGEGEEGGKGEGGGLRWLSGLWKAGGARKPSQATPVPVP